MKCHFFFYRLFVISLFPNLRHLDDRIVTDDQVKEALRLYKRPLIERIANNTRTGNTLPDYIRCVTEKFTCFLTPLTNESKQRNFIV